MSLPDLPPPTVIFAGTLRREYFITSENQPVLDIPGGNALYAAVGYLLWEDDPPPGILARVGENFPHPWLDRFNRRGINTDGINILPRGLDLRKFYTYQDKATRMEGNPLQHFSRLGQPLPKSLLDYDPDKRLTGDRRKMGDISLRSKDLPDSYVTASAVHLCPLDYQTHNLLPAVLRQSGFTTVTLDPGSSYMDSASHGDLPGLVTGLTAFIPTEGDLRNVYRGVEVDLWRMARDIGRYGVPIVIIKRGEQGQYVYDAERDRRWEIPAYPARVHNPTGAGDAFCGGFMAGYRRTYDPLQAALYGSVSASLVVEGDEPFYALDTMPGLPKARLMYLQDAVRAL